MHHFKLRYLLATLALCLLIGLAYSLVEPVRSAGRGEVWSQQRGETLDRERFYLLLFPESVQPEFSESILPETLNRAVLVSLAEAEQDKIEVFLDAQPTLVKRQALTAMPPEDGHLEEVEGLNKAIQSWKEATDWRRVSFDTSTTASGVTEVTLRVHAKRGYVTEYQYQVSENGQVTPAHIHQTR